MAYDCAILKSAQHELNAIIEYLLGISDGPSVARNFLNEFEDQINQICENPHLFGLSRFSEFSERGYRVAPIKSYVMLHFVQDACIFIAHIVHTRQDYARLV